jgi:hypothetical protein
MFDDLDLTLRSLLTDPAAPDAVRAATIDFATPDRDYKPSQATLNVFLHDVGENRNLRNQAPWLVGDTATVTAQPPVLRVDCNYLVTSWSNQTGGIKVAQEHRLLAQALTWLGRFPVIGADRLTGNLASPPQPYPVSTLVAQTAEGQQMGHFWSALGIAPRPAFSLWVTITLQPSEEAVTYPAVTGVRVQTGSLAEPRLSGRVLDAALNAVSGAVVTVDGTSTTTTTSGGDFVFPGLSFGPHTLRAHVSGQADVERSVAFARNGQIHNLLLSGP